MPRSEKKNFGVNINYEVKKVVRFVKESPIFDKYFVKFLLNNFENSVIGTSSPVTLQKKVLLA